MMFVWNASAATSSSRSPGQGRGPPTTDRLATSIVPAHIRVARRGSAGARTAGRPTGCRTRSARRPWPGGGAPRSAGRSSRRARPRWRRSTRPGRPRRTRRRRSRFRGTGRRRPRQIARVHHGGPVRRSSRTALRTPRSIRPRIRRGPAAPGRPVAPIRGARGRRASGRRPGRELDLDLGGWELGEVRLPRQHEATRRVPREDRAPPALGSVGHDFEDRDRPPWLHDHALRLHLRGRPGPRRARTRATGHHVPMPWVKTSNASSTEHVTITLVLMGSITVYLLPRRRRP